MESLAAVPDDSSATCSRGTQTSRSDSLKRIRERRLRSVERSEITGDRDRVRNECFVRWCTDAGPIA
jgi:hypothetical protein